MNITQPPELLDQLAAGYALGTLRGGARRRFETLAREQAPVRAAALLWQTRWSGLTELQPGVQPSPAVWTRIQNLVRADVQRQAMHDSRTAAVDTLPRKPAWFSSLFLWRGAALAGVVAMVLSVASNLSLREQFGSQLAELKVQLQSSPQITYVAVLADAQSKNSMLVTFDPKNSKLVLQRLGGFQEASDKSLQLWALPPSGGPRSLGVLGHDQLPRLTAAEADIQAAPVLAVSLEPLGGVPGESGPTGPVLFTGPVIKRML